MHNTVFLVTWTVAVAICGVLFGVILDDLLTLEAGLYKWSTLITGFLAICAAGATVAMMEWTDQRQQNRHNENITRQERQHAELMKLNLRNDRLAIMRAADPFAAVARILGKEMKETGDGILANLGKRSVSDHQAAMARRLNEARGLLMERSIADARPLFEPTLASAFREAAEQVERADEYFEAWCRIPEKDHKNSDYKESARRAAIPYRDAGAALMAAGKELQLIAAEYSWHHSAPPAPGRHSART